MQQLRIRLSKKCLAEFAAVAVNNVKSIFDQGVYLGENTYQTAKICRKAPWGIFDSLKGRCYLQRPVCYASVSAGRMVTRSFRPMASAQAYTLVLSVPNSMFRYKVLVKFTLRPMVLVM